MSTREQRETAFCFFFNVEAKTGFAHDWIESGVDGSEMDTDVLALAALLERRDASQAAATPDLLAACELVLSDCWTPGAPRRRPLSETILMLEQAIAKARGAT